MAIRYSILILFLIINHVHATPRKRSIQSFPLDERTVYQIKIANDQVTTIMFPSAITALEGSGITLDPKIPAQVLMDYKEGKYFFSVRALTDSANANLNVIWNRKTYVIQFKTDDEPMNSVTFYQPPSSVGVNGQRLKVSPSRLLNLLDRAKSYQVLAAQYPDAVQQIERATPHRKMLYKDFSVSIEEVFRFDVEDALVFRILLSNEIKKEIYYQPQALAVRVGPNVYYSSIADASGIMPPAAEDAEKKIHPSLTTAYFAITGTPNGGRNNLSVENDFNVIVTRQTGEVTLTRP